MQCIPFNQKVFCFSSDTSPIIFTSFPYLYRLIMDREQPLEKHGDASPTITAISPRYHSIPPSTDFPEKALSKKEIVEDGPVTTDTEQARPPTPTEVDGGYGWVCVVCVFLINAHTWGINSVRPAHDAPNNAAVCSVIPIIKITLVLHTRVVIVATGAMNWAILRERPPTKA